MDKVLWNGASIEEADFKMLPTADWFRFAPGFFESIKASHGILLQFGAHYDRMSRGAEYWNVTLPEADQLQQQLQTFLNDLSADSGKMRIQFGVDVNESRVDYLAILEVGHAGFPLNEDAWSIGVYKERFKDFTLDSNYKSNRRDIYLLAQQWGIPFEYDDVLVINQDGRVADSIRCNLFWLKNGLWRTPPLHSACVPGVMRQLLMRNQEPWGIRIIEEDVYPQRLLGADEVFLTNAIQGIRSVGKLTLDGTIQDFHSENTRALHKHLIEWEQQQHEH